jgi:hypothetical protein
MAEVEISQEDIVGLGDALDGLQLNDGQRALLSAIVAMAADTMASRAEPVAIVEGPDTTTSSSRSLSPRARCRRSRLRPVARPRW